MVLPLLQAEVVPPGWVTNDQFSPATAPRRRCPGPLFTFAAYLGAVMRRAQRLDRPRLCLVAVFLPSFLLMVGALPFWEELRGKAGAQPRLRGVNAAVVGLLLAALYHPVWTAGITGAKDFALAIAAFLLLYMWQTTPWLVVILSAVGASLMALLPASIF